jgi:hypothetical protein
MKNILNKLPLIIILLLASTLKADIFNSITLTNSDTIEFKTTNFALEPYNIEQRVYGVPFPYGLCAIYKKTEDGFANYSIPFYFDFLQSYPTPAWGEHCGQLRKGESITKLVTLDAILARTAVQFSEDTKKLSDFLNLLKLGKLQLQLSLRVSPDATKSALTSAWLPIPSQTKWSSEQQVNQRDKINPK